MKTEVTHGNRMQDELPKRAFYQPEKLISTSCHSPLSYKKKNPTVKIFLTLGLSKKLNSLLVPNTGGQALWPFPVCLTTGTSSGTSHGIFGHMGREAKQRLFFSCPRNHDWRLPPPDLCSVHCVEHSCNVHC